MTAVGETGTHGAKARRRPWAVRGLRRVQRSLRHRLLTSGPGRGFLRWRGRRVLYCLGDSHARVFDRVAESRLLDRTSLDVTWVLGATALGLANPNSTSNALKDFREVLDHVPVDEPLVILLGEIDAGYLIWYRSEVKGHDLDEEFERSVGNYTEFLESLVREGRRQLIVATLPPPTIEDYATWKGLGNARELVTASIEDRTAMTLAYNQRLRAWAATHDVRLLDIESDVMDDETGRVRADLVNPDPLNHHLHPERFAEIVAGRLRALGFE